MPSQLLCQEIGTKDARMVKTDPRRRPYCPLHDCARQQQRCLIPILGTSLGTLSSNMLADDPSKAQRYGFWLIFPDVYHYVE